MYKKITQIRCNPPGYITKLLLVMKLTVFLLIVSLVQVSAFSFGQKMTLNDNDITYERVFREIRKQTGYDVLMENTNFDIQQRISIHFQNAPLTQVLDRLVKGTNLTYLINKKSIVFKEKTVIAKVKELFSEEEKKKPRQLSITGRVSDTSGAPLPGAVVQVKGSSNGTFTKENGTFKLINVAEDAVLVFKMLGFERKEIPVNGRAMIPVVLKMSLSPLDEAQVIAYGTTTKRFNTGNVTTITSAEIEKQPIMNPLLALQGRVPGLFMQRTSAASSAPVRVEIRGKNSLNPNALTEPLYVIDGIPQTTLTLGETTLSQLGVSSGVVQAGTSLKGGQSLLFSLNSNDIESISVLKDADATAIYGSRAANGVILITTKKGTPGRTNFNINLEQGLDMVSRYPKMLNLQQYLAMRREALKNDGITPTIVTAPELMLWDTTRTTDWFSELAGTGHHTNVTASVTGGDARTNFRLSGSYSDRVDLYSRSGGNTRSTVSLNMGHTTADKRLNATVSATYGYTKVDVISEGFFTYMLPPNAPSIFDTAGNLNFAEWDHGARNNPFPFEYLLQPNSSKTHTLNANLSLSYTVLEGLTLSGSVGYSSANNANDFFMPMAAQDPSLNPLGRAVFGTTKSNGITFAPQINYNTIWGKGRLKVLLGGDFQSASSRGGTLNGSGYTHDDLLKSINNAPVKSISEAYSEYKYAAAFGRINFNWDWKYVLNINARRDGSSRFAPGKQFGNFGSVGFAWIASEENWLQTVLPSWMSFVKLRGSYGITGSDGIGDYEYLNRYAIQGPDAYKPLYPYNGIQPYVPVVPFNQEYQWESLKSLEGALTLGFVDDRINLELAWYQKRSSDQLTIIPTPVYTGFPGVRANWRATVQNRGVEASVSAKLVKRRDLQWNMNFHISRNTNKLHAYPGIEESPYAAQYIVGRSLKTLYFMNLLGVDPLTGAYVAEDYNKDGKVTTNRNILPGTGNDDRYIAVNLDPRFQGGLTTDLRWKNYGISLHFIFVKQLGLNPLYGLNYGAEMRNSFYSESVLENHWQKPGDRARFAAFGSRARYTNSPVPVDGSFIRLQNVAFNYELPEKIAQKVGMQRARFSLRVQNLFTITPYRLEPEMQGYFNAFSPLARTVAGSLSLTF